MLFILSIFFLMIQLGFFSTKRVIIDKSLIIDTQDLYFLDSKSASPQIFSECIIDLFCPKNIDIPDDNQSFDITLGYKNVFNNAYLVTVRRSPINIYTRKILKDDVKINDCSIKKTNHREFFEARIIKQFYLIGISTFNESQRNNIVNEICNGDRMEK